MVWLIIVEYYKKMRIMHVSSDKNFMEYGVRISEYYLTTKMCSHQQLSFLSEQYQKK